MRLGATVVGSVVSSPEPVASIPGTALDPDGTASRLSGSSIRLRAQSRLAVVEVVRYESSAAVISSGVKNGDIVVIAGAHALRPGQQVKLSAARCTAGRVSGAMNLSEWALRHRSLVWFLMVVIVAMGLLSYQRLGRNEDPDFTVKTMVVQAGWPGATVDETLKQVTDRIEKKLQETPSLDFMSSYTTAGRSHRLRQPAGLDASPRGAGHLVSGAQEGRRHPQHAARRASSGPASTTSSATPTASSMGSRPTDSPTASCATTWKARAHSCCASRMSPRSTSSAPRTRRSTSSSRRDSWPAWSSTGRR